jgi:hypothetical protein
MHLLTNSTQVSGTLRGIDGSNDRVLISPCLTPIGQYPAVILRHSDIISVDLNVPTNVATMYPQAITVT